jgi:hypothetical protein
MAAVSSSVLPRRSEIENWHADHLSQTADALKQWREISLRIFTQHVSNLKSPGGTEWTGKAADAASDRGTSDLDVVRKQGLVAQDAEETARRGSGDVAAAKRRALDAISEAEDDGFKVGDDLSLTDTRYASSILRAPAARAQVAKEHSEFVRWRAAELLAADTRVGNELQAKAAELEAIRFDGEGGRRSTDKLDGVQLVSNEIPLTPRFPLPQKPWEYNLDLTADPRLARPGLPNAGTIASIDDVWNELNRCFNCSFPIGGAPKEFPKVGDKLPLTVGMGSNGPNLPFPVEVTQIEKTADQINIEFKTLPGHVDGEGSTIHFTFYEDGGQLHLGIRGYIDNGPGAVEEFPRNVTAPVERLGYTAIAGLTWQPYIDRLVTNIAAAEGVPIAPPPSIGVRGR